MKVETAMVQSRAPRHSRLPPMVAPIGVCPDTLRAQFIELMTRFQSLSVESLTECRAQGVFRAEIAAKDAAILLIALVQGLAIRWSLGQRAFLLETEGGRLLARQISLYRAQTAPRETE